jgi:hypothetical protein
MAGREVRFEMRLSVQEAATLDAVRGSASRSAYLREMFTSQAPAQAVVPLSATPSDTLAQVVPTVAPDGSAEVAPDGSTEARHFHRPGVAVRTWYEQGTKYVERACETCGEVLPARKF